MYETAISVVIDWWCKRKEAERTIFLQVVSRIECYFCLLRSTYVLPCFFGHFYVCVRLDYFLYVWLHIFLKYDHFSQAHFQPLWVRGKELHRVFNRPSYGSMAVVSVYKVALYFFEHDEGSYILKDVDIVSFKFQEQYLCICPGRVARYSQCTSQGRFLQLPQWRILWKMSTSSWLDMVCHPSSSHLQDSPTVSEHHPLFLTLLYSTPSCQKNF